MTIKIIIGITIDEEPNANVEQREGAPMYGTGWLVNGAEWCSKLFFSVLPRSLIKCAFMLAMFSSTVAGLRLAGLFKGM